MRILTKEQYCYSELVDRLKEYHGDDEHVEWVEGMYQDYVKFVQRAQEVI